ncbi:tyrosine-type recombinase/integrase [Brevibacillus panacihumi]|uniref:tyrosine-type recombinase/integrase n=1 Tax=Brevibacillus panacihumi TaxID=497735 RepID=UPI003D06E0C3
MQLRRTINASEKNRIDVVENIIYGEVNLSYFYDTFEKLKQVGYVIGESFDQLQWFFPCDKKLKDYKLVFDLEFYQDTNVALKGYILLNRFSGLIPEVCYERLQILKRAIQISEGFTSPKKLEGFLLSISKGLAWRFARVIIQFLNFYSHPQGMDMINLCNAIPRYRYENRDLPSFIDILTFSDIIDDFFSTRTKEDHNYRRFFPIQLWWKISTIIPMRPIEFVRLKFNCIETKPDNSFWLTLSRAKKSVPTTDTIQIDRATFQLVTEFQDIVTELGCNAEYLFSYQHYYSFLDEQGKHHSRRLRKTEVNRITDHQFIKLLNGFYDKVVSKIYGHTELERITPGDTRHFAIMNMFLQGFNMLSIARMAGHDNLETQDTYYSHSVHYAQSYVYHVAQKRVEEKMRKSMSNAFLGERRKVIDKGRIHKHDLKDLRLTDYGYCQDKDPDFPTNCATDCRICDYYLFKPSIEEYEMGIKWLEEYSNLLSKRMENAIDFMIHISKSMHYELKHLHTQSSAQEKLSSHSRQLTNLMDHKSIVDARIMELKLYEK